MVQLFDIIPLIRIAGTAELSVAVIVQYGWDLEVPSAAVQEPVQSGQASSLRKMWVEGGLRCDVLDIGGNSWIKKCIANSTEGSPYVEREHELSSRAAVG